MPCPYGPRSTLRFGRRSTNVHWTFCAPPSAYVRDIFFGVDWVSFTQDSRSSSFHYGPPRTKVHRTLWAAPLRSALNGWSTFHFGPCKTDVHRTSWGLRFASVGAKRMSTGHPAPHHPQRSGEFFFPKRMGLEPKIQSQAERPSYQFLFTLILSSESYFVPAFAKKRTPFKGFLFSFGPSPCWRRIFYFIFFSPWRCYCIIGGRSDVQ